MSLKVDLSKMSVSCNPAGGGKDLVVNSITIGDFTIRSDEDGGLMFLKDDLKGLAYIEMKNRDMIINGRSVKDMWSILENHYESLKKLIESHK